MSLNKTENKEEAIRSSEDQDIAVKFKTYRMSTEFNERKLKHAKIVIDRLNDEIHLLRDVEKNLEKQISHAQKRLIHLQKALHQVTIISEQQRENAKTSEIIDQKIKELDKLVKAVREQTQNLLTKASKELDIIKENDELKATLKATDVELNLTKSELQSLKNEKIQLEIEVYEQKIKTIQEDLERIRSECWEKDLQYNEALLTYKKQIQENEEIIKNYERERKNLLEEFEPPRTEKDLESCSVNIARADSTVSINSEERKQRKENNGNKEERREKEEREKWNAKEIGTNQLFGSSSCSQEGYQTGKRPRKESKKKFPWTGIRQKPQLEFISQSQGSSQNQPEIPPKKWRLFSTNYNHYFDI